MTVSVSRGPRRSARLGLAAALALPGLLLALLASDALAQSQPAKPLRLTPPAGSEAPPQVPVLQRHGGLPAALRRDMTAAPAPGGLPESAAETAAGTTGRATTVPPLSVVPLASTAPTQDTAAPGAASVVPVATDALAAPDPETAGLLDDDQGGLGLDLWRGTRRDLLQRLLDGGPEVLRSAALRDVERRALLTTARAPESASAAQPAGGDSLLALRAQRLFQRGRLDDVVALLGLARGPVQTAALHTTQIDAMLLANDVSGACAAIDTNADEAAGSYREMVKTFCQLQAQRYDEAQLAADLLRETGEADDAFLALVDRLAGRGDRQVKSLTAPTPLHLAMLRAADQPLPDDLRRVARPALLQAIAMSPNAPIGLRLATAEEAMLVGALKPEDLLRIYAEVKLSEEDLAAAQQEDTRIDGARGRAALFRVAQNQPVPAVRAEVLQLLLNQARREGRYGVVVPAVAMLLRPVTPSSELTWFAAEAARVLYLAGEPQRARGWMQILVRQGAVNETLYAQMLGLWPIARMAEGDAGLLAWDARMLAAWRQAQLDSGDPEASARVGLVLSLFDALDEPIVGSDWDPLYASDAAPQSDAPVALPQSFAAPEIWQGLLRAADGGRRGEAVLFAVASVGTSTLDRVHPVQLAAIVRSLRRVGLDAEARAVAVEAALTGGV